MSLFFIFTYTLKWTNLVETAVTDFFFSIQNGPHVRLHNSVGLDGVELRLTKKDNKTPME